MGNAYRGGASYVVFTPTIAPPGKSLVGAALLSGFFRNFEAEEEIGLFDVTAGPAGTAKTYSILNTDGRAHLEAVSVNPSVSGIWAAVVPGTQGTLEWGEEGNAAGKPKHYVTAIVMNRKRLEPYDGVVTIQVEFQFSGAVTDSNY